MSTMMLEATGQAPDFSGIAVGAEFGDGMPIRLGDYFDSQIVLYFYPQDDTPGCHHPGLQAPGCMGGVWQPRSALRREHRPKATDSSSTVILCRSRSSAIPTNESSARTASLRSHPTAGHLLPPRDKDGRARRGLRCPSAMVLSSWSLPQLRNRADRW